MPSAVQGDGMGELMGYTKGEWKVDTIDGHIYTEFVCTNWSSYPCIATINTKLPEAVVNAHLIAATKEMYEFLKDLAEAIDDGKERIGASKGMKLSQILAKAEGRA